MKHLLFMIGCFAGILFSVSDCWGQKKSFIPWDAGTRINEIFLCMEKFPADSYANSQEYCVCFVKKLEKKYPNLVDMEDAMRKDKADARKISDQDWRDCEKLIGIESLKKQHHKIILEIMTNGIKNNAITSKWDSVDQKILSECITDKIILKFPTERSYNHGLPHSKDTVNWLIATSTAECVELHSLNKKTIRNKSWQSSHETVYIKTCIISIENEKRELGANAMKFHTEPFCLCLLDQLKSIYPNPDSLLKTVSEVGRDEFYQVLHGEIVRDCRGKHIILDAQDSADWSPTTEKQYHDELLADLDNEETRKNLNVEGYCKCALLVSKKYYPRRMDMYLADNIPNEALSKKYDAALDSCATKYRKEVREKDQDINTGFRPWTLRDQERFVSGCIKKTDAGNKKSARKMNAKQYCTCLADKLIEQMPNYAKVEKMINNNTLEQYMNRRMSEENDQCAREALTK